MLENYLPVLMFILVGLAFGIGPMIAGGLLAPHRPDAKSSLPTNAASRHSKTRA
jgi:NADH-quinone oxidoreductase subunit A